MPDERPISGSWYQSDEGDVFTVAALDETRHTIDIRYLDGRVEEIDLATWRDMELYEIETPEEWHGSMNDLPSRRRPR